MRALFGLLPVFSLLSGMPAVGAERVRDGLEVFYDFHDGDGGRVRDRSGSGKPLDLTVGIPTSVTRDGGVLKVHGPGGLTSVAPAARLSEAVRRSGELSIEAWITPAETGQSGPARIISLSKGSSERNFTLGQDGARFDVRLRSTGTSTNGIPSTASPEVSVKAVLTHVVFTRHRDGTARIHLDGKEVARGEVSGGFDNWDGSLGLVLGDEFGGGRAWRGSYHLVAVYSRALSAGEVALNLEAGPDAAAVPPSELAAERNTARFENEIAPILANHCIECHDPRLREGKLDLSQAVTAFAEGKHGSVIVPGDVAGSVLWEVVESDEMPEDGEPLTAAQKEVLKEWIEGGAHWSLETIDPANYLHGGRAGGTWVQRLTVTEYIETVRSTVGVDISVEARELLPRDLRADGFSNTAYNLNVDFKHVEAYARLAETIVERMEIGAFADRFSRDRRFTDEDMGKLIAGMGRWILRGPLEDHEIITYRGITTAVAAAGGSYDEAVGLVVEAMLQSPRFLYRIERQNGDGTAWPVAPQELAVRMSYIIWGAPPDEALLRAAESGELADRGKVREHARRMLEDPRAVSRSLQFVTEWLNLDRLKHLQPNPELYPDWDPALAEDMREETLAFFKDLVWNEKRPLQDLFNAQFSHLTPGLARHYGLEPQGEGRVRYDLATVRARGGLLTQGSVLTVGGDEASMVTRGLFVMHDLLRGVVHDPPPGVDTTPVPSRPGLTQRDAALKRIHDKTCGGCHSKFEPLAFGLERFDGLGAYREIDHYGNALREDGEVLFPGRAGPVTFANSAELMDLLAGSDRIAESITWKLAQFALGRPLGAAEARAIREIHEASQEAGGTYSSLLTELVASDLVHRIRTESAN